MSPVACCSSKYLCTKGHREASVSSGAARKPTADEEWVAEEVWCAACEVDEIVVSAGGAGADDV